MWVLVCVLRILWHLLPAKQHMKQNSNRIFVFWVVITDQIFNYSCTLTGSPEEPGLGKLQPKISHSIEIIIQAWKQTRCCCNLCARVWLNTQNPQEIFTQRLQLTEVFRSGSLENLSGLACTSKACVEDARLCLFESLTTHLCEVPCFGMLWKLR